MTAKRIVQGEAFGAPVPNGWPDRGPLRALFDLARGRKRKADDDPPPSERTDG